MNAANRDDDLNVVAIASTFPGSAGDGTPEFVLTFSAAAAGLRYCVVAPRVRGGELRERINGVDVRRYAYARRGRERLADDAILPALRAEPRLALQLPRLLWGLYRESRRAVRERRPDLVHAHWIVPGGFVARLVARRRQIPYVVTAHGADAYALNGRVGRWLKRAVLDHAHGVFPVSAEIGERLAVACPDAPIRAPIAMGVDVDELRASASVGPADGGVAVFVGRLSDKKGVDVLVRAVAASTAVAELRIVGDGPDRAELESLASQLQVTDRVTFLGHGDRAAVMRAYTAASVVVLPSVTGAGGDRDGVPVVLMEALALGKPVVASAIGGMAEHLSEDAAVLVPPGDVDALADALDELLGDRHALLRLSETGQRMAEERFSARGQAARFEADVRSLIVGATSSR